MISVPYWDFDAPEIPDEPRDVAAASIICSALFELSRYSEASGDAFLEVAINQINTFASDDYTASPGSNNNFILIHGTGNYPANREMDVPLNYADFYYLEAVIRYRNILNTPPVSVPGMEDGRISIFPNPVSNGFTIELPSWSGKTVVSVVNNLGQKFSIELNSGTTWVSTSDWESGLYVLMITESEEVFREKLLILNK